MSTFVSGVHGIFMPSQQAIYGGRYYIFTTSQTGLLPPQDLKSGTVCHPISDYVGCHTASSGGYWKHFSSDSEATALCELFLTVPNRNILTYLLTYFPKYVTVQARDVLTHPTYIASSVHCRPCRSASAGLFIIPLPPLHNFRPGAVCVNEQW